MPRRYVRKSKLKKKNVKRRAAFRRRRRFALSRPSRSLGVGIPNSRMVKLRYSDNFTLGDDLTASGVSTQQVFRANSLYDPDYTGTGHQPRYFDQWTTMYGRYVVLGSKIRVNCHAAAAGTSNVSNGLLAVQLAQYIGSTTIPNSMSDILEANNCSMVPIHNQEVGRTSRRCVKTYSARKFFRIKDVKDNQADLGAAYNANPTKPAYFLVKAVGATAGTMPTIYCTAIIDYIALLTEPFQPDDS